ncbi:MAG: hypothetical protein II453_12655 [Alphaproteobacteria bacterium]|nr:hypothetical protein [Alphaproteobacteria bacterium]
MPEEQAISNAALIRNHAFFASDAMGISPKEYFDKYAPKIEKTAFSEFGKPKQEAKPYVLSEEELKGVEAPQMTQKDINYAKAHPEWKKNADNIELIERAGASINDDLETINNALRNYATEDYRYRKEREVNHYNYLASQLSEDEQERLAIMVENGTDADEAFSQIKYGESDNEGLNLTPRKDTFTRIIGTNGQVSYFQDQIKEAQDLSENMEKLDNIYPAYEGETININGQEKTVYNSNGDRIAKSKEALENFYRWFGDSKVVDKEGRPLVVYHGTKSKFNVFDKSKKGQASTVSKAGFWFSPSEEFGKNFAEDIWYGEEETIVMPVYLNLQNPKIYKSGKISEEEYEKAKRIFENAENKLKEAEDETQRILEKDGLLASWQYRDKINIDKIRKDFEYAKSELNATQTTDAYEKFKMDIYRVGGQKPTEATVGGLGMALDDYKSPEKYADMLKEQGYDGIIIEDTVYDASNITNAKTNTQYVAFESNQIKSTDNRGTYSESENIYYQFAGEKAQTAALDNLRLAQNMEINDYSTDEIWRETGWYKGKDGKWRFEISDDDAVVDLSKTATDVGTTLGNILSHDKLYSAYPELRGLSVIVSSEMKGGQARARYIKGVYDKDLDITIGKRIEINSDIIHRKDVDLKSIIMHEVQHAIQDIEGFASGGSVSTFFDKENMDVFQKLFQEEDNKKFNQAVLDALYEEVSTDAANKISDADDKVVAAAEKFALAEGDGIEEAQVYDDALEELDNALKEAGKNSDWFAELKTKAREKAGVDIMGRSKRAKNYDPFELYKQLYGEVEARNTQSRMDLTEEERRAKTPESTQDIKNADAIVIFDDGTAMAYEPETYYQSAFAGSRVDYDRPSLEAIGSGEGNQIKSTSNRGTYSESENINYQEGDDRDLVVLHSISPANLRKSIEFGGFAVPSLAIVRKGQEFHFDDLPITLVGNKEMIDPYDERNEVYNRDVWTKTFPWVTYKKPTQAKEKSFKNKIGEYYKRTNSENELGSFIYVAQRGDTSSALSQFENSNGAILYYLENIKKQKVEFAEKDLASDILQRAGIDETLANEIQGLDADTDRAKITESFKRFLERKDEEDFSDIEDAEKREKMIKFSRKLANENYFDKESGNIRFNKADTIVTAADNYFRSKGKKFIDQYDVRSQLREMIKDDENYQEWATEFFENELVGDKMVQVGNTLKPFTLDNVVEAMTSGKTIASQATPLPAMGKVIASGAKKLESIIDIKEEGKRLVTDEQSRENMEKVTEALYEFLDMFDKDTSFEINMDRKDAVAQALQEVLKNKNVTKESLRKAILRNWPSEKTVSDEALSYGVELAKQIKDLARYYFEAKPQRAVGLKEFSAAIIPTSQEFDEIAQYVAEMGLDVVRSDNQQEALQDIDTKKNVFFQDEQAPRGAFANDTIYLFENANESTLPHELTHSWQKELRRINETNPTEKLTGMLEQIDNWTSSEFTRKYSVSKRNYGYAVIDKRGNVVYDNRGNGFLTEQDAVEYAKDEIFARGFEQYVREGKAPNNSLKQAFRNFFMWLKKIYRDAMDLNIQLSPDIKNVYADLLGGVDVDFFLDATPESFIQQRIKLGEQREKTLDGIIQDAQANKQRVVKTKRGKGFSRVWSTAMIPLSTRAKRISPKLRNVLRKYEFTLSNELNKKYDKVRPFMDLWKNMSEDDIIAFDFALKNDYVAKQLEIVDKYNARKEWEAVRETLENIYDEALNAGLDINWRPDYFPRKVKDVDGFLSYLHNAPEWTRFQQAISEAGLDGATAEEQAEFLNKYLRGFVKVDLMPNKYGSEKERKIDIIDNEMNQFYAPSIEALVGYIEGLNSRIVSSKFLGKGDNIEESIGGYLTYLLNNNIIAPEQIDEARNILRARFDARGVSNPWLANMRNYSYMYTMGGINSAITQIEDLSVAMYKAGVWNTLTTAMESKRITKKDLGLTSISAEFVEQSKSAAYLGKLFKLTGLDGIDSFGKETLVNAELKKFQKMSDETLREYIEPIMEEETNATIQDIRNNTISDNVLYLMFSELSDVQPISLSELPEFYNRGGNLRVLYMLKSFALKRIDIFRNECVDKIKSKDFNQVKEGMQNLLKLSALMVICGSSKDWLIDLLYGRETDMSERVLNNILGLVGLSKFQIYQAKEKGFTGTVKDIVVPPLFAVFDDLFTDVAKGVQGKREIKDFEVWKGIPLVGRFYYWWVGRGSEKQNKKKKY